MRGVKQESLNGNYIFKFGGFFLLIRKIVRVCAKKIYKENGIIVIIELL